ncbi:formate dehydrogenase accessory sulfurtransferase FdhD [Pseudothermotoga thermarum]|uniref:Formate dehydrogenase family accessory protein FdhD n=1 Tax=Pseudothermotoga thermarum DSM 5069 TaxID=688269 RepID=F7YUN3_9THEM|nr:formate dehydrogenase accessory sulfurtransferase FdhD [Pseudothermotoga thermarum]AEH50218.1 formate dehydrogenase family accessory protein FdhD [Pseudothermotoga thermarum DSM 5069]
MKVKIFKCFTEGFCECFEDLVIDDSLIRVHLNGEFLFETHCLAEDVEEFVLGYMVFKGIRPVKWSFSFDGVNANLNLHEFKLFKSPMLVKFTPCMNAIKELQEFQNFSLEELPFKTKIRTSAVLKAMDHLLNDELHKKTGAVHLAGLYDSAGEPLVKFQDIGRHNAVDKVVGWMVKNNVDPTGKILLSSGRLPYDMVVKAVHAGVEVLASKAPAMASAIQLAEKLNLTLIGFVREGRMNVYTHPERVEEVEG